MQSPPIRLWFFNNDETRLIQVQADRFILNWKRGLVGDQYPHYEFLRQSFESEWANFRDYVSTTGLGSIEIRNCEFSYVNHIEPGIGWEDFGNLERASDGVVRQQRSTFFHLQK